MLAWMDVLGTHIL